VFVWLSYSVHNQLKLVLSVCLAVTYCVHVHPKANKSLDLCAALNCMHSMAMLLVSRQQVPYDAITYSHTHALFDCMNRRALDVTLVQNVCQYH